jgi:molybdopterin-binding protein
MELSTRNCFKGTIKKIELGAVNAEITIEIAPGLEVVSVITKSSAERLKITEGKEAYALFKSTDVAIAVE